jgi:hypothetical protein
MRRITAARGRPRMLLSSIRCPRLAWLIFASFLLTACGATNRPNGSLPKSLLASLARPGSRVAIDEDSGRFGIIAFGQSVASVKQRLPSRYYWLTQSHGNDLMYCSNPHGAICTGATVHVFDRCDFRFCDKPAEGIGRIELAAGQVAQSTVWRSVSTLRGIHLGSRTRAVVTNYKITDVGPEGCGGGPPPGATYVTVTGANTTVFTIHAGTVWSISVRSGKDPHFCRDHVLHG